MCFPFKAGCELGLVTITLSTFPFQGSPSASSGAGRINTATGQRQFLAHGSRRSQHLRKEPTWRLTWHLPAAYVFLCAPLLGTTVLLFPIVFLQFVCKHFKVGTSFDFVTVAERSWLGVPCDPQVSWKTFLSGGMHVSVPHVPPYLCYTAFPVDTPNVNLRNVFLGAGENESVSFLV